MGLRTGSWYAPASAKAGEQEPTAREVASCKSPISRLLPSRRAQAIARLCMRTRARRFRRRAGSATQRIARGHAALSPPGASPTSSLAQPHIGRGEVVGTRNIQRRAGRHETVAFDQRLPEARDAGAGPSAAARSTRLAPGSEPVIALKRDRQRETRVDDRSRGSALSVGRAPRQASAPPALRR